MELSHSRTERRQKNFRKIFHLFYTQKLPESSHDTHNSHLPLRYRKKGKNEGVCTEMRVNNLSIAGASETLPELPVCAKEHPSSKQVQYRPM